MSFKSGLGRRLRESDESEDSSKLNTSFVERLNQTIRQGSAYLFRRTMVEGTSRRSHRVASPPLQFRQVSPGVEIRTRSQDIGQAGWVDHAAADGEIFSSRMILLALVREDHVRIRPLHNLGHCR